MDGNQDGMKAFWETRYGNEGMVWGERASKSAAYAASLFAGRGIRELLIPGAGYGRNTKAFSDLGYRVTGVEISGKALAIARDFDPKTEFVQASVLDAPLPANGFDAIYCFNVLHLFRQSDREQIVSLCTRWLRRPGYAFFTVFSMEEPSYGRGAKVEENTFESKPGRPTHYFTDADLRSHFAGFEILETGILDDPENHGEEGEHVHRVAYIFAKTGGNAKAELESRHKAETGEVV
jgi:SAM-dependent methyltransferase